MTAIFFRVAMMALLVPFMTGAAVADIPAASDEAVAQKATALLNDPNSPVIGNPNAKVGIH